MVGRGSGDGRDEALTGLADSRVHGRGGGGAGDGGRSGVGREMEVVGRVCAVVEVPIHRRRSVGLVGSISGASPPYKDFGFVSA